MRNKDGPPEVAGRNVAQELGEPRSGTATVQEMGRQNSVRLGGYTLRKAQTEFN